MGQVALGVRSLLIKIAIFVAMAALLAWALGGTLFPRAETADGAAVAWNGSTWRLRVAVGGDRPGQARWRLLQQKGDGDATEWSLPGFEHWSEAAGPVAAGDTLYVAFRDRDGAQWTVAEMTASGVTTSTLPDRLEVERQFARVRNGLSFQAAGEAAAGRDAVLNAGGNG
jgi:hypothetical protein